jgi:antibiotic biosynthesis monooxygenase
VVLINAFEVPPEGDDAFLAGWERTREFLHTQPGYLTTRLCRSLSPEVDFRFVNIGRYASPQAFQAAIGQPSSGRRPRPSPIVPISACTRSSGADGQAEAACCRSGGGVAGAG